MSKETIKNKALIKIGYHEYVLDITEAVKLMALFEKAEFYEDQWHPADGDIDSYTSHHIGSLKIDNFPKMKIMPSDLYHVALIAGPKDT